MVSFLHVSTQISKYSLSILHCDIIYDFVISEESFGCLAP